ncbi:putative dimethylallyl tryptophan synthase [Aspergillus saccharolyticus JOP 1030-1]|uniref:Putative dimethylallyl tryptophan synthase n=1 Tax=Aspergillus saccharolyticus JOP 1030-1 TaxID=1450539 RepID=A0A318Z6T8_9EURO|nr:putative dimethylallyl tryptophan synthase [Aspergillus saccharolyticus JOP 1030-1]PYH43021.1 putative dimethylallyl tryptophan synthase [Aspergillus saccharolyticus JOP 1030-1]
MTTKLQSHLSPGTCPGAKSPYIFLSQSLLFQNPDEYDWWHRAAPVLAQMLSNADYNVDKQYQYLTFLAHHVIPALGPSPESPRYNLYRGVFDLEFSQNFQQSGCIIRLAFIPASYLASVPGKDPFNRLSAPELLAKFAKVDGIEMDLRLYQQLAGDLALTKQEEGRLSRKSPLPPIFNTQTGIALDLRKEGKMTVKLYTFLMGKSMATATPVSTLALDAIKKIDRGTNLFQAGLQPIEAFLDASEGTPDQMAFACPTSLNPRGMIQVGTDLVDISRTRFKLYLHECMLNVDRLAELWTLGGRLRERECPGIERGLEVLRQLWDILQIHEGYHFPIAYATNAADSSITEQNGNIPTAAGQPKFLILNYEIHPSDPCPVPKVYFPLFGMTENTVIDAMVAFFERIGWTDHASISADMDSLLSPALDLDQATDVQFWLSFSYSAKTGPYTTVYYRGL